MDKGQHLDLSSGPNRGDLKPGAEAKPFLGIHFACCDVYARVYPNKDRSAYVGRCPRCIREVRFAIGPGGTDSRFFTAK